MSFIDGFAIGFTGFSSRDRNLARRGLWDERNLTRLEVSSSRSISLLSALETARLDTLRGRTARVIQWVTYRSNQPGGGPIRSRASPTAPPERRARRIVFHSPDTVVLGGRYIRLSPMEYDLLKALAESYPNPVSSVGLLSYVWGRHASGRTNYLKLYIHYLRTKLERIPSSPEVIITQRSYGYRLAVPPTFF